MTYYKSDYDSRLKMSRRLLKRRCRYSRRSKSRGLTSAGVANLDVLVVSGSQLVRALAERTWLLKYLGLIALRLVSNSLSGYLFFQAASHRHIHFCGGLIARRWTIRKGVAEPRKTQNQEEADDVLVSQDEDEDLQIGERFSCCTHLDGS